MEATPVTSTAGRRSARSVTKTAGVSVAAEETASTEQTTKGRKRKASNMQTATEPKTAKQTRNKEQVDKAAEQPQNAVDMTTAVAEDNGGQARKRKRSRKVKAKETVEESAVPKTDDEDAASKCKRSRKVKTKEIVEEAATTAGDGEEAASKPKRQRKPRPPKPEPVYVIPDIERRETTFKGRLGYACLNTILRNRKPAHQAIFCSRTCRIDTIKKNGLDFVKELGRKNAEDMLHLIEWNEQNNIKFMRMSSEMFPFASHATYGYSLSYCADTLAEVGALASKYGHRLTTHPGQFTQLGSPRIEVVEAAVRDLKYHCEMLDLMGIGKDGVMIIHGGGVYGDKPTTIERIKNSISNVLPPNVRARLVLENDEFCYSAEDLLPVCESLDIPLVFDYHHDALNPSATLSPKAIIARANVIFERCGIKPKQHLSEPRPGAETIMEKRAHADRCEKLPDDLPDDMDLMIEAKDKEQAVLHLYRIYGLQPVNHASLRPPRENQTKETLGRKSTRSRKAKEEEVSELADEDDPEDVVQPVEDEPAVAGPHKDIQPRSTRTRSGRVSRRGNGVGAQVEQIAVAHFKVLSQAEQLASATPT